jgi:hypothetical protein
MKIAEGIAMGKAKRIEGQILVSESIRPIEGIGLSC